MSGMEIVERKKVLLLTAEQEKEFERLKIQIQHRSTRDRAIDELLVLLGILHPYEIKRINEGYGKW